MQQLYPVFLDVTDRRILVVGGGAVAVRKVRGLFAAGAKNITVVSPEFAGEMPEGVGRVVRRFEPGDLEGVELCFVATADQQVNEQVTRMCQSRRIWVNRADRNGDSPGSLTIPAVCRSGRLTIAVSAEGSPALAATVRDQIAQGIDPVWKDFAEAAVALRHQIRTLQSMEQPRRQVIFQTLASEQALAAFREAGKAGLIELLSKTYPDLVGQLAGAEGA